MNIKGITKCASQSLLSALLLAAMAGTAQYTYTAQCMAQVQEPLPPPLSNNTHVPHSPGSDDGSISPEMQEKMAEGRNTQRQKRLEENTKKLVQLADQLQTAVNRSNKNILSIDVIHRAEKIEKLAKQIQDEMKAE
ncbi:MAG TPA: hypothetical protein VHX63_15095 [Acidobacteriaceae bacterium]|jgi:aspartate oxidase|nr:hypothetical protein [Acidobacteriaceae bacterium]